MKIKLLTLFFLGVMHAFSQTQTYQINWTLGVNGAPASKTIEEGDTIEWVWGDAGLHTVTNKAGSAETFDSGDQSGMSYIYSHTFSTVGTNDYQCNWHPMSMFGTITVVAEGTLSIQDFSKINFTLSPNPTNSYIKLSLNSPLIIDSIEVFDILGHQLYFKNSFEEQINISKWPKGMYLLKLNSGDISETKKIIKQ